MSARRYYVINFAAFGAGWLLAFGIAAVAPIGLTGGILLGGLLPLAMMLAAARWQTR